MRSLWLFIRFADALPLTKAYEIDPQHEELLRLAEECIPQLNMACGFIDSRQMCNELLKFTNAKLLASTVAWGNFCEKLGAITCGSAQTPLNGHEDLLLESIQRVGSAIAAHSKLKRKIDSAAKDVEDRAAAEAEAEELAEAAEQDAQGYCESHIGRTYTVTTPSRSATTAKKASYTVTLDSFNSEGKVVIKYSHTRNTSRITPETVYRRVHNGEWVLIEEDESDIA